MLSGVLYRMCVGIVFALERKDYVWLNEMDGGVDVIIVIGGVVVSLCEYIAVNAMNRKEYWNEGGLGPKPNMNYGTSLFNCIGATLSPTKLFPLQLRTMTISRKSTS